MGTAGQVDGLADALLRCVEDPDRIARIQVLLDRYCHRLRNRLNSMKLSLYLARRLAADGPGPDWPRADSAYRAMEAMIEQVQSFCSMTHPASTDGDFDRWIEDRLVDWRRLLDGRSIRLEADGPDEPMPGRFDWPKLGQMLDALVADWARLVPTGSTIRLSWGRSIDRDSLRFEGAGPLARPGGQVESLMVPLLARVLDAHQGTLSMTDDATSIELSWPADRP